MRASAKGGATISFIDQYQNLIGALVTLIAALVGFWGLIYSQRRLTNMAEDVRADQRRHELVSFLNAILGELSSLQGAIDNSIKLLNAQAAMAEELAKGSTGRKTQPRVFFRFATPVFDSYVGRIGLLSPDLSYKVSNLYGQLKGYSTQAQEQVPELSPDLAVRIMRSVGESLQKLRSDTEDLKLALSQSLAT